MADYLLAAGSLLCVLVVMAMMFPRLRRVRTACDAPSPEPADDGIAYPPVSVIVTADDDAWNLPVLLPQLLRQDYPAAMEVIVVDNGDSGPTETVVASLQNDYPNLYLTYVPANSRNLSRKKLAVTIGVKAARFEHLLLTCGNCRIESPLWLRSMARHFAAGKEVVAGYSYPLAADPEVSAPESRLEAFDRVRASVEWLASGLKGRVWRADANNLGYTRTLFYNNKGFQRSLNFKYGDDDIFISEIAAPGTAAVELSDASRVIELVQNVSRAHRLKKIHRDFTARYLRRGPRLVWSLMSWMWWGWLGFCVAAIAVGLPSLLPFIALTAVNIAAALTVGWKWRATMSRLNARRLFLTVGWFITVHPLYTLLYRLRGRRSRAINFTWTTEK